MLYPGALRPGMYDPSWLVAGLVVLVAALFVAISRGALLSASRRRLLTRSPSSDREAIETFLGLKDEFERTLDRLDIGLRCGMVACLVVGRLLWLEGFLDASATAGDGAVGGGTLAEQPASVLVGSFLVFVLEVATVNILVLELLAALFARVCPEAWLMTFRGTISHLHALFTPLRWFLKRSVEAVARALSVDLERSEAELFEEEILEKVEEGEREGLLESKEGEMIESIIEFGDVEVSEVMTPRTDMILLDLDEPLQRNLDRAVECGYSRIPVYLEHKDNITGILYVKDLLKKLYADEEIVLDSLVRKPYCVPTTKKLDELLQELKQKRLQIAIVLDEYGGTDGLVTIEDIMEHIVGDITDEYEPEELELISTTEDGVADVDASVHIDDLNEALQLALPESENYDTVGGLLFASMGRIPAVGDTFEIEGVRFEVTKADDRRVLRLKIRTPKEPDRRGGAVVGRE